MNTLIAFKRLPPIQRLKHAMTLLLLVFFVGVLGYHLFGHQNWVDAAYMAVITLTTVGFREVGVVTTASKIFTMVYLVAGLGIVGYAISNLTAMIVEGDLQGYLRERRMDKRLESMSDHIIVCGFGKMGFQAAWELKQAEVPFVVVEADHNKGRNPRFEGDLFLYGSALDDFVLERAGVMRAKGLISTLTTDADNVLVTLTARQFRPDLPIVARSAKLGTERQLKAAGANHIVSPYEIGGRRMAALLLRPEMINFLDVVVDQHQLELGLEHILISPASELDGLTLREARLRDHTGALIVGIQREGQTLHFNPQGSDHFLAGDVVLAMGPPKTLEALKRLAHGNAGLDETGG
jgi:voltage-gated potassium channel